MRRFTLILMSLIASVLSIASSAQTFTTLHDFAGSPDGAAPYGGLVQGTDGNLYGTTQFGGSRNGGTVFKITPGGTLSTLYNFCSQPNCSDGSEPYAGLVQAADGNFYGTTSFDSDINGTIFKITPSGALTTLHVFTGYPTDGSEPYAGLVQATDGSFYGTTVYGGQSNSCANNPSGCGTVFKVTPQGVLTTLYSFSGSDGANPHGGVIQATDGNFYGTTTNGGSHGGGTAFKLTPGGTLTTLYNFCAAFLCSDGNAPYAALIQATDGNFYGTNYLGGPGLSTGTIFKLTPQGVLTTLYGFSGSDGANPYDALVQASDGNFYGTTYGAYGAGTIFKITPQGALTTLHTFDYANGRYPYAGLVQASDGNFYGTTTNGGANAFGTVFVENGPGVLLSVTTMGNGTVTSNDGHIDCGSTCSYSYKPGTLVTLTATADQGWAFTGWNGCDNSQGGVCTVTMTKPHNVSATFKVLQPLSVDKIGNGTVSSLDGHIYCGNLCSFLYIDGTQVSLSALPAPGYTFTGWTGCDNANGSYCYGDNDRQRRT